MKLLKRSLMVGCLAAGCLFVLSGCGGSSDSAKVVPPPAMPGPDQQKSPAIAGAPPAGPGMGQAIPPGQGPR